MKTFKTPKGTELPLISLKGKDYLQVQHRLVWFREEHPTWGIETDLISVSEKASLARAQIKDEQGRVIATAHKTETSEGFGDFAEKSETGAIGRALALIGYGTQFAQELEEGERIVDAPATPKPHLQAVPNNPGDFVVTFGQKYLHKKLSEIDLYELSDFAKWLGGPTAPQTPVAKSNLLAIEAYLKTRTPKTK